ncbi:MAG: VOC family protein [Chloroflexi bacterium]|nr:VOC family protein [Chloroflexota bacterium]
MIPYFEPVKAKVTPTFFSHIGLTCKDPAAQEHFYSKYFGFRRARVLPLGDDQIVFIRSGNFYIELFKAKEQSPLAAPKDDGYPFAGIRHMAFEVESVEAKLAELGSAVKVMLGPADFGSFIPGWMGAWVADPEGNIIELNQGYVDQALPPALV